MSIEALMLKMERRAKAAAVRVRWQLAKSYQSSITDADLRGWFSVAFDEPHVPDCPLKRVIWLIEVRDTKLVLSTPITIARINAAILNEVGRIKAADPQTSEIMEAA